MSYAVSEIARLVGGKVVGNSTLMLLELAGPDELSFVSSSKHFEEGQRSRAGCH